MPVTLEISIDPALAGHVRLGALALDEVAVRDTDAALQAEADAYAEQLRHRYGGVKSAEVPGAAEARALYKALGLDPTKTRPSSEALLRRVLKGQGLPTINTLVDALNLCSVRYQLPFGLYDLDNVRPPIVLRRGDTGEGYEGIRKDAVNVTGRPVLADVEGPFGNPSSDSSRTMVTVETKRALVVVYAPALLGNARLDEVLDGTESTLTRFCDGRRSGRWLLPPN
jgi:DNA/RNA-binding domain of Phe-tRNA-synthetase-like protein